MTWVAHFDQEGNAQTVREHSEQTARLSAQYAMEPLKSVCYLIGLMHDVGKYAPAFQERLHD
ncbi:MAG: HD domain-containing protein, partial [Candidatus Spyradocola sp.]